MKKILFTSLFAACAAMSLSSCMNGDYDANPAVAASGTNPLNTGNNNTSSNSFNWTGTDPMSVKMDGTAMQATSGTAVNLNGLLVIQGQFGSGKVIQIQIPTSTATGATVAFSGNSGLTYFEGTTGFTSALGTGGSVYVTENDATHCKGKFYANVKDPIGGTSHSITEGYFNITK